MTFFLYQFCAAFFLLQGFSLPVLVSAAFWLLNRQQRRLDKPGKQLNPAGGKVKTRQIKQQILDHLPQLEPLNCQTCGAGVVIRENGIYCPHCQAESALPDDYQAALALKAQVKSLVESALRQWRIAKMLTGPPVRSLFLFLLWLEPVVFLGFFVGDHFYPETSWVEHIFDKLGDQGTMLSLWLSFSSFIKWLCFFSFLNWMIVLKMLSELTRELRRKLPRMPVLKAELARSETSSCQSCGGAIEYAANDFACLCPYCNVENFRVQYARTERLAEESQQGVAKTSLFGAMQMINDFVGNFAYISLVWWIFIILCCIGVFVTLN